MQDQQPIIVWKSRSRCALTWLNTRPTPALPSHAAPGKGAELAQAFRHRCADVAKESGCEQFEVFQSVVNPDKLALLELWSDQAALDVHAKVNLTRAPMPPGLRAEGSSREDYEYNLTR